MGEISDIQAPVMDWAERNGWLARRLQYINRNGAPDAMFIKGGEVLFMEFKRPRRGLDPQQKLEWERFALHGKTIFLIDSVDDAISTFKSHERPR